MKYQNYVFDLYGTLVDIHTDEEQQMLWEKMAMFYGYQGHFIPRLNCMTRFMIWCMTLRICRKARC